MTFVASLTSAFRKAADMTLGWAARTGLAVNQALDRLDDAVRHLDWVINGNEANAPWTRNGHPSPHVPSLMEDFCMAVEASASLICRAGKAVIRQMRRLATTPSPDPAPR